MRLRLPAFPELRAGVVACAPWLVISSPLALAGCLEQLPEDAAAYACQTTGNCADIANDVAPDQVPVEDAPIDTVAVDAPSTDIADVNPADLDSGAADVPDVADIKDVSDISDVQDTQGIADTPDALGDADSAAAEVSADATSTDAADTTDTPDSTDTTDASDTPDAGPICLDGCDDKNLCTTDSCKAGACVHLALSATPCDDGDACSKADVCTNGVCKGLTKDCPSAATCYVVGTCDPATGACSLPTAPTGAACDDGDACTLNDGCADGKCKGAAKSCPSV